jgi:hypothetical protein
VKTPKPHGRQTVNQQFMLNPHENTICNEIERLQLDMESDNPAI